MKKHSKALVFFAASKQIPIVYSADRGRAEIKYMIKQHDHKSQYNPVESKHLLISAGSLLMQH